MRGEIREHLANDLSVDLFFFANIGQNLHSHGEKETEQFSINYNLIYQTKCVGKFYSEKFNICSKFCQNNFEKSKF